MDHQDNTADRLLALTRAMWVGASEGEWERVIELEAERRTVMDGLFPVGATAPASERTEAAMREVLDMDKRTMELLEQQHGEVGRQLRELASRRKARAAYAANSP
jgi:hypothetical protein